jgi:hypothetical protein
LRSIRPSCPTDFRNRNGNFRRNRALRRGSPLAEATIYALPREATFVGRISLVKTEEFGNFRPTGLRAGETAINAYDLEEGYLDPYPAFNSGNKFLTLGTLVPKGVSAVQIALGPKCVYLIGPRLLIYSSMLISSNVRRPDAGQVGALKAWTEGGRGVFN